MAKIIVFGDIDISALYLKIDDEKEISVTGRHPQSFTVPAGAHHIFATTVSRLERVGNRFSDGGFVSKLTAAVQNGTNTTLDGEVEFDETDVLLMEVQQKGLKTVVNHKLVSENEVEEYIDACQVVEYGAKKPRKILKWLAWLLFLVLAVLVLMVLWVMMAKFEAPY